MPSHYYDDEYRGAEHATDVFRAPKKEKTAGQKLEESGGFMPDPEQEDLSQQVNYSTMEENYARERRPGFDREMEAIGKAKRAGNLTDQELIEAHKRAKRIREAEDEIDPETGWPMYLARGPLWLLKKYGQLENFLDDQVGIPGTDIDWYHARQKVLKPAYETHLALGILGEIFLPTSIDLASWGSMYIPNRFRQAGKAGIKLWASITKAGKTTDEWAEARRIADKYNMQMNIGYGDEISSAVKGDNYLPNPSPDELLKLHKDYSDNLITEIENLARDSVNPNIPLKTRVILSDAVKNTGYTRGGVMHYDEFREFSRNMAEDGRAFLGPFQAGTALSGAPRYVDFNRFRGPELTRLREEFRPAIQGLGLTEAEGFNVHHIAALKAVMGIWDGLQLDSRLYRQVSEALVEQIPGLVKGLGDNPNNLLGVVGRKSDIGTPHNIVHKFYADTIGESGEKFFTPEVLAQMKVSRGYRLAKAKELGKIIAESERIVRNAQTVFQKLYGVTRDLPEDLVESLHVIPIDNKYTVPVLKNLLRDIIKDFDRMSSVRASQNLDLLKARIADPSIKMRVQGKRKLTPKKVNKEVDKAVKDAGDTYQPTLDPKDPKYNP